MNAARRTMLVVVFAVWRSRGFTIARYLKNKKKRLENFREVKLNIHSSLSWQNKYQMLAGLVEHLKGPV